MRERVILIAEDDEQAIISWEQDVREFNRAPDRSVRFVAEFAKSKRSAINVLNRVRINCAVVDLRLPEDDGNPVGQSTNPIGNAVLEQILLAVGVPAVVYSGYIQETSELVQTSRIRVLGKKGGGAMEALNWLAEHESLMSAMEATRNQIEKQSARLFNQSIWPRWEQHWKLIQDPDLLAGVLTRQMASHIAEELSLPPHFCHPEEFYIVPPLSTTRLNTGDLVTIEERTHVVVTPRCNLARDQYPDHLMLAHCKKMENEWTAMRNRFNGDQKKQESAAKDLRSYATQGHATGTHFLPPCAERGPWLVDFKEIITVSSSQATNLLGARFASIAPQFIPNLVQRYAAYLGRIGQPDLDCEVLRAQVCK